MDNVDDSTQCDILPACNVLSTPAASPQAIGESLATILQALSDDETSAQAFSILRSELMASSFFIRFLTSEHDSIVEGASAIMAHLSGSGAAGKRSRTFVVAPSIPKVRIFEMEFASADVGWSVWPSAVTMLKLMQTRQHQLDVRDARVLELGCGCGLPGISAALLGAKSVLLTDHNEAVLRTVRESVAANDTAAERCDVRPLDWSTVVLADEPITLHWKDGVDAPADIVLASDCIYDEGQVQLVCKTLQSHVRRGGLAAIVCGERAGRVGTTEVLEKLCSSEGAPARPVRVLCAAQDHRESIFVVRLD